MVDGENFYRALYKIPIPTPHTFTYPPSQSFPHRGLDSDGGSIMHWGLTAIEEAMFFLGGDTVYSDSFAQLWGCL